MNKLYVMIGISGSGKSTWCETHFSKDYRISRDEIRFSLLSSKDDYFAHEKEVLSIYYSEIERAITKEQEIIIADATHLTKRSRRQLLEPIKLLLKEHEYEVIFVYCSTLIETAVEHDDKRVGRRKVGEDVIEKQSHLLEEPTLAECMEWERWFPTSIVKVIGD